MLASWMFCVAFGLGGEPDFGREVRPILADKCYACHGPDAAARKAELRLDRVEEAIAAGVIAPGDAEGSELVRRVESDFAKRRMPPPESKLALTEDEQRLLRRWIEAGAEFQGHWAFEPLPARVDVPAVVDEAWPRAALDRFVLARLEAEGLAPSPEADRRRWLRRASFDLTGLPPTPVELADFEADEREDAYERVVERLLASPRFGERMAVPWLDAARYGDSYGYQSDQLSPTWPWRDWVVRAFNENLPYDRFLTLQLAGDLIERPTRDSRLATAFNRLHRMTNEGGSVAEEWRLEGVADRVQTFGASMLGLTLECARCHDHKFDPVTQREHYGLAAFFASIDEHGVYNDSQRVPTPTLLLPTPEEEERERELVAFVETHEAELAQARAAACNRFTAWMERLPKAPELPGERGHYPLDDLGQPQRLENLARPERPARTSPANLAAPGRFGGALRFTGDHEAVFPDLCGGLQPTIAFSASMWLWLPAELDEAVVLHNSEGTDTGYHGVELSVRAGRPRLVIVRFWPGNAVAVEGEPLPKERWVHLAVTWDGHLAARGMRMYIDGVERSHVLRDGLTKTPGHKKLDVHAGHRMRDHGMNGASLDELRVFERALSAVEVAQLYDGESLARALAARDEIALLPYYLAAQDRELARADDALRRARKALLEHRTGYLEVPVMEELDAPRPTHVLARGAYDAPTDERTLVAPHTPAALPALPVDAPRDRLALARWLTQPEHPLTARVAVNRCWALFFDRPLVGTTGDFGLQGAPPTHAELLDHLARRFVDSGWDVKRLCRELALSASYRQDSRADALLRERDPENALCARGPSRRLSAEMLRDAALFAAGLLDERTGGPPVRPYQPGEDLWTESNAMSPAYHQSVGTDLHRRSLYTVWKRTAPMPNMLLFDAPMREVVCTRRQSTSTPLQALVLLNDLQFVEAARALAQRTLKEAQTPEERVAALFERLTSRPPEEAEAAVLRELLEREREAFRAAPERAAELLALGEHPLDEGLDPVELAATAVVAQAVLNLDAASWRR